MSESIGKRIRDRREALKISQDELAQKLGYKSRSSINKIELGRHNLTQTKIKAIADALQTTPAYIMGWIEPEATEKVFNTDPEIIKESAELTKIFFELCPADREYLLQTARRLKQ